MEIRPWWRFDGGGETPWIHDREIRKIEGKVGLLVRQRSDGTESGDRDEQRAGTPPRSYQDSAGELLVGGERKFGYFFYFLFV